MPIDRNPVDRNPVDRKAVDRNAVDRTDLDQDRCYRVVCARDARFDGWFVGAVTSTGIYCRPSCPVRTPRRANMRFYPTAAAAQSAGFRACKRCRPDASPGSPEWDPRGDVVARAMRLIADGVVDRDGVEGLAGRLGYSARQVERLVRAEVGTGPLALARAQRARTARTLIETTDLAFAEICFAAGFSSVRQFNATVREVYDLTPGELRIRARRAGPAEVDRVVLRLPVRAPFAASELFGRLARQAVPGLEEAVVDPHDADVVTFRRALTLERGAAVVALTPRRDHVAAEVRLEDLRDLTSAVARCRWLLDLDADPVAADAVLAADPALAPSVAAHAGLRAMRSVDGAETAVRVLLAQQVSTAAARTHAARLVAATGVALPDRLTVGTGITRRFPTAGELAGHLRGDGAEDVPLALPTRRRATLLALIEALAAGWIDLGPGADRTRSRSRLAEMPGIGPWTVEVLAMRTLGDPDAFPVTDLAVRRGAVALGLSDQRSELIERSEAWRPWRSIATHHLWLAAAGRPTCVQEAPS